LRGFIGPDGRLIFSRFLIAILILILGGCAPGDMRPAPDELGRFASRDDFLQRLEPRGNRILHGAGANRDDFAEYWDELTRTPPVLYATHFDLMYLREDWTFFVREAIDPYPLAIIPQIGLSMTYDGQPYTQQVARGDLDMEIEILCRGLAQLGRPVFLRLGYGFGSPLTGYRPESYRLAWERVVETIRLRHDLRNVAMVWCSVADGNRADFMAFYPGDQYVDWWGVDLFDPRAFFAPGTEEFVEAARQRGYPIMIGEAAPRGRGIEPDGRMWERWFVPFFRFIRVHPNVKAFCYINWAAGNTRIAADLDLLQQYRDTLDDDLYQHAAPLDELRWQLEWEE